MTTLRYSPSFMLAFYNMVRENLIHKGVSQSDTPKLHELDLGNILVDSQKEQLGPEVETVVSVLLTNDEIPVVRKIERVDRQAIYDGLLTFGSDITLFIENKPQSGNVWEDQLCPSRAHLADETNVIPVPAVISWRDVVDLINRLIVNPSISGSERMILSDLQAYMGLYHPYLNPYREFAQCGNDKQLLYLRIEGLLREVAVDPGLVRYHNGWAHYIAAEGHPGIDRVALVLQEDPAGKWFLQLFLGFADTINQARAFYERGCDTSKVADLRSKGWEVKGNFHLSHMQRHLYWYPTDEDRVVEYIKFWVDHTDQIYQYPRNKVVAMLQEQFDQNLLNNTEEMRIALDRYVMNTNRTKINMAPGVVLHFHWTAAEAIELDRKQQFRDVLAAKIKEGFTFLGEKPNFIS